MTFGGSIGTWLLALVEVNLILARVETGLNKYWLLKHSLSWPIFLRNQTLKNNFNIMNVKSKIQCLFGGKHTSLFEGIILQKMYYFLAIAWCINLILARVETGLNKYWLLKHSLILTNIFLGIRHYKTILILWMLKVRFNVYLEENTPVYLKGLFCKKCTVFCPLHDALKCAKLQRLSLRVNIFLIQLYFQK